MTKAIWQNNRNPHKYLEIRNDGHYHNRVRQFMKYENGVVNLVGDRCFHRWRINNLKELLKDYHKIQEEN